MNPNKREMDECYSPVEYGSPHVKLSQLLALAIGWPPADIEVTAEFGVRVKCTPPGYTSHPWMRGFDFRDPTVIWPIAKHFEVFPLRSVEFDESTWSAVHHLQGEARNLSRSPTAEHAVAVAVIAKVNFQKKQDQTARDAFFGRAA